MRGGGGFPPPWNRNPVLGLLFFGLAPAGWAILLKLDPPLAKMPRLNGRAFRHGLFKGLRGNGIVWGFYELDPVVGSGLDPRDIMDRVGLEPRRDLGKRVFPGILAPHKAQAPGLIF